jgi:hypothetical protein
MATWEFRPQRDGAGNGIYADFVPSGQAPVTATGSVQAEPANTTGVVTAVTAAPIVTVNGVVQAQPAITTGIVGSDSIVLASGNVIAQAALSTGQIFAQTIVTVNGVAQAQPAITTGIVGTFAFVIVNGDAQADPAITNGQARVPREGPFDIRMKSRDGEWVKINTVSGSSDVVLTNPAEGDILSLNSNDEWVNDRRMDWQGIWTAGTYEIEDTARDKTFLGTANTQTTDPIAPVPTGTPIYPTDGAIYVDQFQLIGAKVGNRYTMAQDAVVTEARVDINIANVGLLTTVVFHVNGVQVATATYVPRVAGLHSFLIPTTFVFAGDVVDIESDAVKQTGNTQVHYEVDAGYWGTYSNALFSLEEGLFDDTPDTNAYNLDLNFTPAIVSPDWDIMAVSSAALINQASTKEAAWTREKSTFFHNAVFISLDNMWSEVSRLPIPTGSSIVGSVTTLSKRIDSVGYYSSDISILAWNDAGILTTDDTTIFELGDVLLATRVIVDGTDLVLEIRGRINQEWEWGLTWWYALTLP